MDSQRFLLKELQVKDEFLLKLITEQVDSVTKLDVDREKKKNGENQQYNVLIACGQFDNTINQEDQRDLFYFARKKTTGSKPIPKYFSRIKHVREFVMALKLHLVFKKVPKFIIFADSNLSIVEQIDIMQDCILEVLDTKCKMFYNMDAIERSRKQKQKWTHCVGDDKIKHFFEISKRISHAFRPKLSPLHEMTKEEVESAENKQESDEQIKKEVD